MRQRVDQHTQSHSSRFPRHLRKARGFLPGIDVEPSKRGEDAERRSIAIFADRRAEEFVELRPDERRQGGMSHVNRTLPLAWRQGLKSAPLRELFEPPAPGPTH